MMDPFGRNIDYLRISITDRCDERCLYCMPAGNHRQRSLPQVLSTDEIVKIVVAAARLGFRKFRITGGEPLLRPDLPAIISRMAAIERLEGIGLSTNGMGLAKLALDLRKAGLGSVNVSLDALDPRVYRRITGGDIQAALDGVRAAIAVGFAQVKLNCVMVRGLNEEEIWPLALFAAEHKLPLRFVELMPFNTRAFFSRQTFFSVRDAMELVSQRDELIPEAALKPGWGPATYYRLKKTGALVGFIGAMTNLQFCKTCNKLRVTADGKLRPCLGDNRELDLRPALVDSPNDALRKLLAQGIQGKPLEHEFATACAMGRPMNAIGG